MITSTSAAAVSIPEDADEKGDSKVDDLADVNDDSNAIFSVYAPRSSSYTVQTQVGQPLPQQSLGPGSEGGVRFVVVVEGVQSAGVVLLFR